MKRFFRIGLLLVTLSLFCFCGTDEDIVPDQVEDIEDYLDDEGMTYTEVNGVYRVIANSDREDYDSAEVIEKGDSVYYYYASYTFDDGAEDLIDSNKSYILDEVVADGGSIEFWSDEIEKIKLGTTSLLRGVTLGLAGCRQGDSAVLYITSDLAYGDSQVGIVDPNSTIMYILNIETVKK